ncbi:hypothetical protein [uncultured Cocleimonas sp.]|uniref:hypothetical protein n=1 Tax=uncultured Cocleimonas sp. TaxID=1051587 RepID=UPI00261DC7A5|nr:hypothetical protein [uncultured Cocleimonas sp.]
MSENVEVREGYYEKLGNIHCGVIKGFKITCGPEQLAVLDDGNEHTFEMTGITAKRNENEVIFSK